MHAISYILSVEGRTAALQATIFNDSSRLLFSAVMLPVANIFSQEFSKLMRILHQKRRKKIGLGVSEIFAQFCICEVIVTVCPGSSKCTPLFVSYCCILRVKYNQQRKRVGVRLFAAKMLDVESSIEVYLKNLDHCLNGPVVVYSKLDIDLKNEVNPFKT